MNNEENSKKKFYFSIDVGWINNHLKDLYEIQSIAGFPFVQLPVNDYFSNTVGVTSPLYLGNNHYMEPVYKSGFFVLDKYRILYTNHLRANAVHFLKQPSYYKGLFEILN
jgi:hypothetical protein